MDYERHRADTANRRRGFGMRPVEPLIRSGKSFAREGSLKA